ncbi:AAA family ATPase [Halorubrum distributum]|uniref:AAA family ATPase n=1 Tax=Halorubrum distributum TaxID=29283 RepID=A0A6B1IJE0_9EURY|nr:AAA family ATPase [Halorubrum terrestre]MYL66504.1 AAA family ATPase [Halorubrum terrestre]
MEIKNVELRNFRPYKDTSVDLSGDSGHIHIIEGPQGAGKTSFHRAVQWALFGGTGPTSNYKTNYNDDAREKQTEEMYVEIKFMDSGTAHTLRREISRFNHSQKSAHETLRLFAGDEELNGSEAQDFIHQRIPEDLKDFFFLDGEKIQDLVDDDVGREVKSEIEKVLKHTAILNAQDDLQTLLEDRYKSNLETLETEYDERKDLLSDIEDLQQEKSELREAVGELDDKESELESDLDEARELLEERNEEAMSEIDDLETQIQNISGDIIDRSNDLKSSWTKLPLGILQEEIVDLTEELEAERKALQSDLDGARRHEIISELAEEAIDGKCPVCGSTDCDPSDISVGADNEGPESEEIQRRIVDCSDRIQKLKDIPEYTEDEIPSSIEEDLIDLRSDRDDLVSERDDLIEEYGGEITESEKGQIQDSIENIENNLESVRGDIEDKKEEIKEIERKIDNKKREKSEKSGSSEIEELEEKIDVVEDVVSKLTGVREAHIKQKRDKIRTEMSSVFEMVSQSEFIRERYDRIDFKEDPDENEQYVLQLVKQDGSRKDMNNHPPSAGETQLAALSFIFGLNKYARYSTTILFDTVAGRLDLENSRAQGEFFASLDDPLILLVTDAEYQQLGEQMREHVGSHHRIELRDDMSSEIVEVNNQ